jgi:hypothetical protein
MTDTHQPSTALTTTQETTPAVLATLDKYARSAGDLYGDLLKFNGKDGKWTAGPQSTEIAYGTELAAIVPALLVGFVKWEDGELAGQEMVPLTPDYDPRELRASLGGLDRALWPKDEDGLDQDLWKEATLLPMKNLATGHEYTYSTSSVGGVRAVKRLVGAYSKQIQAAPQTTAGHLPIVALGGFSYPHPDRKRGTIYNPILEGVDWVHASRVTDKVAPKPEPEPQPQFEDHRSATTKAKRNRKAI